MNSPRNKSTCLTPVTTAGSKRQMPGHRHTLAVGLAGLAWTAACWAGDFDYDPFKSTTNESIDGTFMQHYKFVDGTDLCHEGIDVGAEPTPVTLPIADD